MRTQEPKPYPPTEAEKGSFYEGLKQHRGSIKYAKAAKIYNDKQVENQRGTAKLRDNGCQDLYNIQRTQDNQSVHEWAEAFR